MCMIPRCGEDGGVGLLNGTWLLTPRCSHGLCDSLDARSLQRFNATSCQLEHWNRPTFQTFFLELAAANSSLLFAGDSLTKQHHDAFLSSAVAHLVPTFCSLERVWSARDEFGVARQAQYSYIQCPPSASSPGGQILIAIASNKVLGNTALSCKSAACFDEPVWSQVMDVFNRRAPARSFRVLVFNIGAHFHNEYARYNATLGAWASNLREHFSGLKVWREYAPTHFDSPDGDYESITNQGAQACRPLNLSGASCHQCTEPYNQIADTVLGTDFLRLRIHVLSLKRWETHRGAQGQADFASGIRDCRHWLDGVNQTLASAGAVEDSSVLEHWNLLLGHLLQARLAPLLSVKRVFAPTYTHPPH